MFTSFPINLLESAVLCVDRIQGAIVGAIDIPPIHTANPYDPLTTTNSQQELIVADAKVNALLAHPGGASPSRSRGATGASMREPTASRRFIRG
ncbi:hypothetical protein [Paraburkholderia bannensis]|uniref:hypothetical protein n=1 Tax=Paraburkholderia bannensis TaxID=765414 RepID=UPI002AB6668B|nr:hypothetical protein [Paraburkholderia bannensis]